MLVELYSPAFIKDGEIRAPIQFKNGLNVILGTNTGSNSIGKSSALLAIDFIFGGNAYLNSDGVRHLGNHTVYSCFKFDKKYYFGRDTKNPDNIIVCNHDYSETDKVIKKKDFLEFLMKNYINNKTNLTFRELISTYFRIYGKENLDEKFPLQSYRGQSSKDSIKSILSLFDYFKEIEPFNARLDLETDKLKTFQNARKYSFISNLVGGKTQYEDNIKRIANLEAELESLTYSTSQNISDEEIEKSKYIEQLKGNKLYIETQLERLKRRSKLLSISMKYGLAPTEADLQSLTEYFPNVEIKKIYEVENYHKKLSSILNSEFDNEKAFLDSSIRHLENELKNIIDELSNHKVKNQFSKEFLDKHSSLNREIAALKEQNKAFVEENELKNSKKNARETLEKNIESMLSNISFKLNAKMYEFNRVLYKQKRNAPNINLKNYNSYEFYTPKDTGTGTNFKGMILLDLAVLYLSSLPALAHDSLLFKNIDDEGIDGIIRLYTDVTKINKQVFIAFDKQHSYSNETYKILQNNKVLQLYGDGGELYGKSWNREVEDETKL